MEIEVVVEQILPSFVYSAKDGSGERKKYSFVGRTLDKHSRLVCLYVNGDENWGKFGIEVGKRYRLGLNISSRECKGRWFTEVSVWRSEEVSVNS